MPSGLGDVVYQLCHDSGHDKHDHAPRSNVPTYRQGGFIIAVTDDVPPVSHKQGMGLDLSMRP